MVKPCRSTDSDASSISILLPVVSKFARSYNFPCGSRESGRSFGESAPWQRGRAHLAVERLADFHHDPRQRLHVGDVRPEVHDAGAQHERAAEHGIREICAEPHAIARRWLLSMSHAAPNDPHAAAFFPEFRVPGTEGLEFRG